MSHDDQDWFDAIREQQRMFRLAERDHGLTPKALHIETGIPLTTLKHWRTDTIIPLHSLRKLVRVIPDELTSLLFTGTGKHIGTDPEEDGDMDGMAESASDLLHAHVRARSPNSPGGINIVPSEAAEIKSIGRTLCAKARAVAA
jgi:hypothetical protein